MLCRDDAGPAVTAHTRKASSDGGSQRSRGLVVVMMMVVQRVGSKLTRYFPNDQEDARQQHPLIL